MATVAVDPAIPNSAIGAPFAADVQAALKDFLANSVNDGDTILFPVNRVYRAEFPWKFISRKNITVNGRGSHLLCTQKAPFSDKVNGTGIVPNCVVGGQRWTLSSNTIVTVTAPPGTHPFVALTKAGDPPHGIKGNIFAWYVSTGSLPGNNARTQDERLDVTPIVPKATDNVIHLLMPNDKAWPDGTYTMKFVSPDDHDRTNFHIEKCTNMVFQNLIVRGANTANGSFDPTFEGQHNFRVIGGNGIEIGNCTAYDAWADGVALFFDFTYVAAKTVWVHDCEIYGGGRHGITVNGLDGSVIENCDVHDVNRHAIDVEINGNMQKAKNIVIKNNRFGNAGIGIIAISTGFGTPADISDITVDANVCYGTNVGAPFWLPIGTQQDSIVAGTGGKRAGEIQRWKNFRITNNISTPNVQYGTGGLPPAWIPGRAYAIGAQVYNAGQPYRCKVAVTSATPPPGDPTHWRQDAIFASAPAMFKVQYCDNVVIQNNRVNMQPGRTMWAAWTENCTGVTVSGNHDHTATDGFVSPHFEWHNDGLYGNGTFNGGGHFTASGTSVPSTKGSAQFKGGPDFSAVGKGRNYASSSSFLGGGLFAATGAGKSYAGAVMFLGGGFFPALGLGQNFGAATFFGAGDFAATGRGINFGTATFDGGDTFTATGQGKSYGTATFVGGGVFGALGIGQNFGRATFNGGGDFPAVGPATTYGTATFAGGGAFPALGAGQNFGRGSFDGGGTFSAFGNTDFESGYQDGEWLVGAVKLRGPGWDDRPWDTTPWDGEE